MAAALTTCPSRKAVAAWVANELPREARESIDGAALGRLVARVEAGDISGRQGKEVLAAMLAGEGAPDAIIAARGLVQVSDRGSVWPAVEAVIAENPDKVAAFRGGRQGLMGFFVGEVIKRSGGKANPKLVQELVREGLG